MTCCWEFILKGPVSNNAPSIDEQPGPPLSQNIVLVTVSGFRSLNFQKNNEYQFQDIFLVVQQTSKVWNYLELYSHVIQVNQKLNIS